ncbi:MAG: homoserine kinase [Armatimonadota bacterium]|nr:homoserine kinase [Armatimonadota bacterium]MDR7518463.1 homoserine kinase [Armatimonadota bacterium]MDR7550557.1 homoserine kinase [Armatimonadota bacterium]
MAIPSERVRVSVPASVANLGAGFDCLAAAVSVRAEITLARAPSPVVAVTGVAVPQDETNLIYRSAAAVAERVGYAGAFELRAYFPIPLRGGLGSSAAAIVGGAVAATRLLEAPLDADALLGLATSFEGHPDNVAAALLGGVVIVAQNSAAIRWTRIVPAGSPAVVLAIPALEVETAKARQVLPDRVSREDAVFNLGHTALLVAALAQGRADLLRVALHDRLHQPYRAPLVPGFGAVVDAAQRAGAYGAVLSGSGPTVAALTPPEAASSVGEAMQRAFEQAGVESRVVVTEIDPRGALDG